jgi:molecular chaperone DnaJ
VHARRTLRITVPPGVDSGSRIRYRGEGQTAPGGGQNGDLFIIVQVEQHDLFERDGNDLICEAPISFPQAALGTQLDIPTLDGKTTLKIPAGTQTHKVFRIRNKGMPSLRGRRYGDLFVRIIVETPTKLNERQRELLNEFASVSGDEVHPLTQKFLDKLKGVFGA